MVYSRFVLVVLVTIVEEGCVLMKSNVDLSLNEEEFNVILLALTDHVDFLKDFQSSTPIVSSDYANTARQLTIVEGLIAKYRAAAKAFGAEILF